VAHNTLAPAAVREGMMPQLDPTITRRRLVAGAGLSVVAFPLLARGQGRDRDTDGSFRLLRAKAGLAYLRRPDQPSTEIWGYDGLVPGPALRVRRGEEVRLRLINELAEATTLHWHGVRLPNGMDGVPYLTQAPVAPGASFDYRFAAPDAGTFWYRPFAPEQLDRGLSGALIVEESQPVAVDRDVPILLDDWRLEGDEHLTANGQKLFEVPVKTNERLRLRLVNACRMRPMSLRFDQHRATVMAIDGQPAEPFVARDSRVVLGPGNRLDVFLEMALAPGSSAAAFTIGPRGEAPLLRFAYDGGAPARAAALDDPKPLPANGLPGRIELRNALRVDLPLDSGGRPRTGATGNYGPPLFTAKRGRTIVLAAANRTADLAVIHLHGHHARLLDNLDDGWKPFWLDTMMVAAQQTARLAFVADNPGKWLIDCALLGREDAGMSPWFEVS
jgi:FtsP/CotA-like multicopper oxidase with cupredoxin domain